jgi:acetylornithine deacetylase/succinyl-diaminopimelate desuccinylase-like protein
MDQKAAVLETIDAMVPEIVQTTSELVRVPSVNPRFPWQADKELDGGETMANRVLARVYEQAGARLTWLEPEPGRANLVGVVSGAAPSAGRSLVLNGHVDTVPPGNPVDWADGEPFSGRVENGRIYGRGAADQKAGQVAAAMAAVALRRAGVRLAGDLILESIVGEEMGEDSIGIDPVIAAFPAEGVVVTEGTTPTQPDPLFPRETLLVAPMSAGTLWMTLEVLGKEGHCNLRRELVHAGGVGAGAGVNAIDKAVYLLQMLQLLEQQWGQSYVRPLFNPGHFNILPAVIAGGPSGVLTPSATSGFCRVEFSINYPPDVPPDVIKREVEAFVANASALDPWLRDHLPTMKWTMDFGPAVLDPWHPLCQSLARIRREVLGQPSWSDVELDPGIRAYESGGTMTAFRRAGMPALFCGPGSLQLSHAANESVSVDEISNAAKLYALAAMEWCGVAIDTHSRAATSGSAESEVATAVSSGTSDGGSL